MKKIRKIISCLFIILFGVLFFVVGIFASKQSAEFERDGIETQAEIVRIEYGDDETVYVQYTVGDTTYTNELDFYSFTMKEGDIVNILYLLDNPNRITNLSTLKVPQTIFYVIGGIFAGLGILLLVLDAKKKSQFNRLKQSGYIVAAVITRFDVNKYSRVYGEHPAIIECKDSVGNIYKKKFLCGRREFFAVGDSITVYVDRQNEKKYVIDVDEYLKKIITNQ